MDNLKLRKIRKRPHKTEVNKCAMCGKHKYAKFYDLKGYFNEWGEGNEIIVCTKCGLREEFGTVHASSKRYKQAVEQGLV